MAQIRCKNGHIYDDNRYTNCPFCPVPGLDPSVQKPEREVAKPVPPGGPAPGGGRIPSQPAAGERRTKTVAYWKKRPAPTQDVPRSTDVANAELDPVVGWLVAIDGPAMGTDFRIRWGNNPIGRGANLPISVPQDQEIHSKTHAVVIYDQLTNSYYLKPGEERKLVHIRDPHMPEEKWVLVHSAVQLNPFNVIRIGGSQFMFVPLCGEDFQWK